MRVVDRLGQRYGRLVVIARAEKPPVAPADMTGAYWMCECDCGTVKAVSAGHLRAGQKSCGCLRIDHCVRLGKARGGARRERGGAK